MIAIVLIAATTFFQAVREGNLEQVETMLQANPSLAYEAKDGTSPTIAALFIIKKDKFVDPKTNQVLRAILSRSPKLDLWETAAVGRTNDLRAMLDRDASAAQARNRFGWTPLHLAAFAGNIDNAKLLLDRGADIHSRAKSKFRNTPLIVATLTGQVDMAKLLIDRGADVLERQAKGFTPLHEAAFSGDLEMVRLLLDAGAEINSRTDDGRTPLTEAIRAGHTDVAEFLKSKGAIGGIVGDNVMKSPE